LKIPILWYYFILIIGKFGEIISIYNGYITDLSINKEIILLYPYKDTNQINSKPISLLKFIPSKEIFSNV